MMNQTPNKMFDCSVCLESIGADELETTVCRHSFHAECLKKWLQQKNSCPICRGSVLKETDQRWRETEGEGSSIVDPLFNSSSGDPIAALLLREAQLHFHVSPDSDSSDSDSSLESTPILDAFLNSVSSAPSHDSNSASRNPDNNRSSFASFLLRGIQSDILNARPINLSGNSHSDLESTPNNSETGFHDASLNSVSPDIQHAINAGYLAGVSEPHSFNSEHESDLSVFNAQIPEFARDILDNLGSGPLEPPPEIASLLRHDSDSEHVDDLIDMLAPLYKTSNE